MVILILNAFPILVRYIDHVHTIDGVPLKIIDALQDEIVANFKDLLNMKDKGINLFFSDIDNIKEIILDELMITN